MQKFGANAAFGLLPAVVNFHGRTSAHRRWTRQSGRSASGQSRLFGLQRAASVRKRPFKPVVSILADQVPQTLRVASGGEPHLAEFLKYALKRRLWRDAHGSISVQEGQPRNSFKYINNLPEMHPRWTRSLPLPERRSGTGNIYSLGGCYAPKLAAQPLVAAFPNRTFHRSMPTADSGGRERFRRLGSKGRCVRSWYRTKRFIQTSPPNPCHGSSNSLHSRVIGLCIAWVESGPSQQEP